MCSTPDPNLDTGYRNWLDGRGELEEVRRLFVIWEKITFLFVVRNASFLRFSSSSCCSQTPCTRRCRPSCCHRSPRRSATHGRSHAPWWLWRSRIWRTAPPTTGPWRNSSKTLRVPSTSEGCCRPPSNSTTCSLSAPAGSGWTRWGRCTTVQENWPLAAWRTGKAAWREMTHSTTASTGSSWWAGMRQRHRTSLLLLLCVTALVLLRWCGLHLVYRAVRLLALKQVYFPCFSWFLFRPHIFMPFHGFHHVFCLSLIFIFCFFCDIWILLLFFSFLLFTFDFVCLFFMYFLFHSTIVLFSWSSLNPVSLYNFFSLCREL